MDDFTHLGEEFTQETTKAPLSGQGLGSDTLFPALSWWTNTVLVPCATSPPSGLSLSASTPDLPSFPRFLFCFWFLGVCVEGEGYVCVEGGCLRQGHDSLSSDS